MKIEALKKIMKEAAREAIKEEIKDILMEAIRAPRSPINEHQSTPTPPTEDLRSKYAGIMDGLPTRNSSDTVEFNTSNIYKPVAATSGIDGTLPPGEVDMSQISKLLNS